jgi:hypothetical protein
MDVRIRPWTEDDAPALAAAIAASLPELRPWMPWAADEPQPVDVRAAWIREVNAASGAVAARAGFTRVQGAGEDGEWVWRLRAGCRR